MDADAPAPDGETDVGGDLPERYRSRIADAVSYPFDRDEVTASVVVVTYRTPESELRPLLDALAGQTREDFETVVVDNGTDWDVASALADYDHARYYLRLRDNEGVTFGRNLGAQVARGDVLVFLDDDGYPRADFVEQHLTAHRREGVVAVRGRVTPMTDDVYNVTRTHYDLGDEVRPAFIGTEGNSSFDAAVFRDCRGFDERLAGRAGHEGLELSYRLLESGFDPDQIIYYPDAVIRHDFASGLRDYVRKRLERRRNSEYLEREHAGLHEYRSAYSTPEDPGPTGPADLARRLVLSAVDLLVAGWTLVERELRRKG